jgi:hypothetical protein
MAQPIVIQDRDAPPGIGREWRTLRVTGMPSGMSLNDERDCLFRIADARRIRDDFRRMLNARHRLPDGMCRDAERILAGFDSRLRGEVLHGKAGELLDQILDGSPRNLEIIVRGTPELVNLPWEALRLKDRHGLLFHNIEVTRRVACASPEAARGPSWLNRPLRLLVIAAEPRGLPPVDAHLTRLELEKRLWDQSAIGRIEWRDRTREATHGTLRALVEEVHRQPEGFDVLLLLAHGDRDRPRIALTDESGNCAWTDLDTLIPNLGSAGRLPRLVILASCHLAQVEARGAREGLAPRLVERGVTAVLSFQGAVGTDAAARSAAEALSHLVRGEPIGTAALKARLALQPGSTGSARRESIESTQLVLWLSDDHDRDQPLFTIAPPDLGALLHEASEQLLSPQLNHDLIAKVHAASLSEWDLAAAGPRLRPQFRTISRAYRKRYAELLRHSLEEPLRKLQRLQNSPNLTPDQPSAEYLCEKIARLVFEWETRLAPAHDSVDTAQDRALLEEARKAVERPLVQAIRLGQKHVNAGRIGPAEAAYAAAADARSPSDHVERIRAEARGRARRRHGYVRALRIANEAGTHAEAGGSQAAAHVRDGLRALRALWKLREEDPNDFPAMDRKSLALRRLAFHCLEVCGEAEAANERGDWSEALEALRRARRYRRALKRLDRHEEVAIPARRILSACQTARSSRLLDEIDKRAHDLAEQRQWAEAGACALQGAARKAAGHPRLLGVRDALDRLARRCLALAAADAALACVEAGVQVVPIGTASTRLAEAMRAGPLDAAAVRQARAGLGPNTPDDVKASLARQLGRDTPMLLACWGPGEWEAAHEAWLELRGPADFELARAWAVLALRRAEEEGSCAAWGQALAAWSLLLGPLVRSWEDWLRDDQGEALPRPQRLREDLAHQLVCRLRGRPDAAGCLLAAERSPELYQHPEAFHELVFLALRLAEQALDADEADQAGRLWKAALSLANAAGTAGYGERIVRKIWSAIQERIDLDRPGADLRLYERGERLLRLALNELLSGPAYGEAREALASCLVARGLLRLRTAHLPDVLEAAYDDFQGAHNEQPEPACEASRILTLVLLARAAEVDQRPWILDQARLVLREARQRWPADPLLAAADSLIGTETGLEDPRYEDFLRQIRNAQRRPADGPSANLATRARVALDQGDHENAIIFLRDALPESEERRPDAGEGLPDLPLVHRILDSFIERLTSPSQLALRGDQIALGREAVRRALILFKQDAKLRDHDALLRASEARLNQDPAPRQGGPP